MILGSLSQMVGDTKKLTIFDGTFQFVKWRDEEPTSIKEVLDNCEVIEDAEEL